jgi:hypothetical protein
MPEISPDQRRALIATVYAPLVKRNAEEGPIDA